MKYTDEAEVVARANGAKTGLAASVWGSDAERVGRQIEAGSVFVNSFAKITVRAGVLHYCNAQVMHVFK